MPQVEEAPFVTDETETKPFVMPLVKLNQEVSWYQHADRNKSPVSSRVTKVGREVLTMVGVQRYGNSEYESVRHIDDPFLKNSSIWRSEYGAWDYTPEYKDRMAFEQDVKQRLAALEAGGSKPLEGAHDDGLIERLDKAESQIAGLKISVGKLKKSSSDEITG